MALELAPHNIRVNAIAPGSTLEERDVAKKVGSVQDQASVALYLASNESVWVTGQIISVDGGQSLSF